MSPRPNPTVNPRRSHFEQSAAPPQEDHYDRPRPRGVAEPPPLIDRRRGDAATYESGRQGGQTQSGRRRGDYEDKEDEEEAPRGRGGRPAVPRREYDELTDRYEQLLDAQEALQREVAQQALLIRQLRLGNDSSNKTGRTVIERSQSGRAPARVQEEPRGVTKGVSKGFGRGVKPRPVSSDVGMKSGRGNVAFGSKASLPSREVLPEERKGPPNATALRRPLLGRREPRGGEQGGLAESPQGFGRLQAAAARGRPLVVSHDEEEAGRRGPMTRQGGRSTELRGESEYLRVSSGGEHLSEDQLDRLVRQTRKR
jgi:hypothetical protein